MELKDIIKQIEMHLGFTHRALAEVLHTSENRIKQISAGYIKALKKEEIDILVNNYKLSKLWLLTGEGEMFAEKDNIHQNQSGSNNIQVGGNMGNADRPTPTQQTQIPKNQYCIEDEEVAALCFSAYTSAKALGKVDKLKLYLASAVPEILK